ncbi:SMI1/KNR4 family protein [Myxococcota bacterium]|nr:SMI1/KNR4 family protein [Myxococcota bacterium]MBU1537289.1 SMI1/KNR4 family protein [Myxococcota bacterium]
MTTVYGNFDLTDFWHNSDYALNKYVEAPLTDELLEEIQKDLGYTLPAAYVELMRHQNGGRPARTCLPTEDFIAWAEDHVAVTGIFGIGREKECSLGGRFGSRFWVDHWGYPPIGVYFADCPSAGHEMICLDYRACGPSGEPSVVHVYQEHDYKISPLAPNFETFIRALVSEEEYDEEDE